MIGLEWATAGDDRSDSLEHSRTDETNKKLPLLAFPADLSWYGWLHSSPITRSETTGKKGDEILARAMRDIFEPSPIGCYQATQWKMVLLKLLTLSTILNIYSFTIPAMPPARALKVLDTYFSLTWRSIADHRFQSRHPETLLQRRDPWYP